MIKRVFVKLFSRVLDDAVDRHYASLPGWAREAAAAVPRW